MAMNQNPSFSSPFKLSFGDESIHNGQIISSYSYLTQKHVNGNGLTSSQLPFLNPVDFFYFHRQNGQISQSTGPTAIVSGQLEFNQIVTEVRRTCVASNKVQVHSSIDYEFSVQNQLAHHPYDLIRYSQVTTSTQLLSSTLTTDRFLHSNNIVPNLSSLIPNNKTSARVQGLISHGNISPSIQNQSNIGNQFLSVSNQANHRLAENEPFHNSNHHQNQQIKRKTPPIMDLGGHTNHHMDIGVVHDSTPVSTIYASQAKGRNPDLDPNSNHKSDPSLDPLDIKNLRSSNISVSSGNLVGVSRDSKNKTTPHTNNNTSDDGREYDGRTHSLPCKKSGLYRCPKCLGVFHSSQKFASHMQYSHYRNESIAERNKRLTAKNKRKNKFRLVYSSEGLTVVPIQWVNEDPTTVPGQGMKNRVNVKKEDKVGVNDREGEDGPD
ncbi:hypothetical protein JRO89_XS10G0056200 [Xanthoceras sorbifolium]|uniref:C2H2-type domain-containing protein n=1 Tax=Xanthoceras sorbifolium TaxID=99658 RepID=A0ABQ8HHW5_9ROSI|nr:hypothetical protein JRO89_XS10G0056200 [Xanthoceras sorbifolium]